MSGSASYGTFGHNERIHCLVMLWGIYDVSEANQSTRHQNIADAVRKKVVIQEIKRHSRPVGEIKTFVELFYANAFQPNVPEDVLQQVNKLEEMQKDTSDSPEINALEQQVIQRLANDLDMPYPQADEMFSNVYDGD